jgi:putative protease
MIWDIPEILNTNVDSLKIEGRMRSPHYVEIVTKCYREAIDAALNGTFSRNLAKKLAEELKKEYNRGFTSGFYFNRATEQDQQHKSPTNLSHWRLIKMGSFESYDPKTKMGTAFIDNGVLKKGMDVLIEGLGKSDTYFHQTVNEIEYKNKKVEETPKGLEKSPFRVNIKLNEPVKAENQDGIFIFTEETFESREKQIHFKKNKHHYRL